MNKDFNCDKCGKCCKNLDKSNQYNDLDRGDGICKYFDLDTNLCCIYDTRPLKCRVVESYILYQDLISFDVYIKMNEDACKKIKEEM